MKLRHGFVIKIVALLLCTLMSINIFSLVAFAENKDYMSKISDDVWKTEPDENGKRLVHVTRDVVSNETIADELLKRYGYSWYEYEWDNNYDEIVEPRLIAEFYEKHSIDPDIKREDLTGELYQQLQKMLHENMDDYIRSKRTVTSDLITAGNNEFLKRHFVDEKDVLYNGMFTETIIAYATEDLIKAFAADDEVNDISIFENNELQDDGTVIDSTQMSDDTMHQTGTTSENTEGEPEETKASEKAPESEPDTILETKPETENGNNNENDIGDNKFLVIISVAAAVVLLSVIVFVVVKRRK